MSNSRSYKAWSVPLIAGVLALGGIPALAGTAAAAAPKSVHDIKDDFNGDGYKDLAVGAPIATVGGKQGAGYVTVMYGGPHGLTKDHRTIISRSTSGIPGDPAAGENFGYQLSTGDLDGDGRTDLIIGQASSTRDAVVVWGGQNGLSGAVSLPAATTQAGDFDGDGKQDLVLFRGGRSPGDDPLGTKATVWRGPISRAGKPAATQDFGSTKVEPYDVMYAAAGDVNGDGYADVAVGAPGEKLGDKDGAGMVNVLYGSHDGLTGNAAQGFTQDTDGVPGAAESSDNFGGSVSLLDINGNGYADLAAAAPRENSGDGAVWSLRGRPTGIVTDAAFTFGPATVGAPSAKAWFGGALS